MISFRLSLVAFLTFLSSTAFAGNLTVNILPSQAVSAGAQWRVDGGTWRNNGATVKNLTNAAHTIDYKAVAGWVAPAPATVTLTNNVTTTVTGTYALPASLAVTLSPSTGQWRVDGGAWRNSGTTATGLTPGAHTVSYNTLANYIAPATESVTLVSAQTTNVTRNYIATSNLAINLNPSNGSWQIDGGAWQSSGSTLSGLTPGAHTINYGVVANYISPASESVTLVSGQTTNLTRSYTAMSNLTVTLTPSSGFWKLDGVGNWRESGTTATGLTPGNHTITYTGLSAMISPPDETVALISGQTTSLARSYTPAGQIFVMLNPNTAQWRVDGGAWRATHTYTGWIAAGSHTVEYSPLPNMLTPAPQTVTVVASQTLSISKFYTTESALIVNLAPAAIGQWRIDGGAWQSSGARVGQLTAGSHSVEYSAAAGYSAPPTETVSLSTGTDKTIARSYLVPGSVTVNVTPSAGQWRLVGGAWQASGTTLSGLRPGSYGVELSSVPGWFDVPTYGINLAEAESKVLSYEHLQQASITATLAPGTGQWRVNGGAWQPSGAKLGELFSGNYTVDYSPVAGMTTPPSETFALSAGEQKSLTRSYGGAPSLTINLSPAGGQWRLDGGAWQPGGGVLFNVASGSHVIDYAPLTGYLSPATETVWFRQDKSLNLSRNYLDSASAYLEVKAIPSYLAEIGVAKWRVDGGAWNVAGAPVSVSSGTHTLEFQPVSGIDVPPATTVTVTAGAVETIEATFYLTHRLRFFLHADLVGGLSTEDLQARLAQYATHLQTIWHRESLRRLTFNPATDITIVSTDPFSLSATPPLPEYGFELWVHAKFANGSIYGSHGGDAVLDSSGAGGADGLYWTEVYDPSTLAPNSTELSEYWKQIDAVTHEFEHVFGAGLGEYYNSGDFDDASGIAPLYSIDFFTPEDPFWNSHSDFWGDPLLRGAYDNYRLGNPNALPALLDAVHFSATSRGIVNGCYRNADGPFAGITRTALPDLSRIQIRVVDATTGQIIPSATLRIWNQPNPGPMSGQERVVVPTSTPGIFEFNWTADSSFTPLNSWDNGKLVKAYANGYQPKAQWEWIYDAQRVKTVDNSDVWEITVALDPAP
jgi:hypothetical protein